MLMSLGGFSTNTLAQENDSLTFSIEQAKQLLKDANKGVVCDSLLNNRAEKLIEKANIIEAKDEQVTLRGQVIQKQKNQIEKANKKAKRLKVFSWVFGSVAAAEALILALVLL